MGTPSLEAVAEFESCMHAERIAWKTVAGRLPGSQDYEKAAWLAWVEHVARSDIARERVQSEILSARQQSAARHSKPPARTSPAPRHDTPPCESAVQGEGEVAGSKAPLSSRPMPLAEAAHGTNLRFRTVLRQAGFQWSQFQTNLMKLGPQALFGHSFIVTVTHAQLGMSRTYQAVHESGWLPDFQQDLEQGVFSPYDDVRA